MTEKCSIWKLSSQKQLNFLNLRPASRVTVEDYQTLTLNQPPRA